MNWDSDTVVVFCPWSRASRQTTGQHRLSGAESGESDFTKNVKKVILEAFVGRCTDWVHQDGSYDVKITPVVQLVTE